MKGLRGMALIGRDDQVALSALIDHFHEGRGS